MKHRSLAHLTATLLAALLSFAVGCADSDSHSHEEDEHAPADHARPCGFKEGHGVFVGEETRAAIGVATTDVVMKAIPQTVRAGLEMSATGPLAAVPESSLLSTAMGDFVFTENGDYFQRTAVKILGRADGWITVADGLFEGDVVVTNGVRELWRIELQATKGGAACVH